MSMSTRSTAQTADHLECDRGALSSSGILGGSIEVARTASRPVRTGRCSPCGTTPHRHWNDYRETYANQFDGFTWRGEELVSDSAATTRRTASEPVLRRAIDNNSNVYVFYHINRRSADPCP